MDLLWIFFLCLVARARALAPAALSSRRGVLVDTARVSAAATAAALGGPRVAHGEARNLIRTTSGLEYYDVKQGPEGTQSPQVNDSVTIDYSCWLEGFESDKLVSRVPSSKFVKVALDGSGQLIDGMEEGILAGMRVGGVRRMRIPPSLAYGADGYPRTGDNKGAIIPAGSTLFFEVRVRSVALSSGGALGFNLF